MKQRHDMNWHLSDTHVAIVGGGSIGTAFAVVFAAAGYRLRLYEPAPKVRETIPAKLAGTLQDLEDAGLLEEPGNEVAERVLLSDSLEAAVESAEYVQECAPEGHSTKERLFADLDAAAPPDAVLASSSSALPASAFAAELRGRHRCLVVHPSNPPFLLRVAEIVPAPFTAPAAVRDAQRIVESVGLTPIVLRKEVKGFIFNRLQGAVLREAYCLVRDGVADVEDIDRIMRDGLGLRWSILGPFETVDLNTVGGIARHAERLGPAYLEMGAERGQHDPWTPDLVAEVEAQRRRIMPLSDWSERVRWRDRMLMRMVAAKAGATTEA